MHATVLELEAYVSGRLDAWRSHELDEHCEGCASCAAAVMREAQLEVAVRSVAAELRCGVRADVVADVSFDEVSEAPVRWAQAVVQAPRRRGFFALAAAAAIALAFVAARLPTVHGGSEQPGILLSDAGDVAAAQADDVETAVFDDVAGGTQ
jgi:anti-sigma factor RsiW